MLTRLSAGVAACTLIFAAALWWAHAKRTPLAPDMEDTERIPTEGEGQEIENDQQLYDYYLVLDVEGTCIAGSTMNWPNEIIEWPVVLLGWQDTPQGTRELSVLDEFRSYVRPTFRPKLSEFCTQLTGITQSDVDSAETWKEVIKRFNRWMRNHNLVNLNGKKQCRFTWCTDGPYDIRDFVAKQCWISATNHPNYMVGDIIDVKLSMREYLDSQRGTKKTKRVRSGLQIPSQLAALDLPEFEGRRHSGIDDARNIARVVSELARRGFVLRANYTIRKGRRWPWMGRSPGQILPEYVPDIAASPTAVSKTADEW